MKCNISVHINADNKSDAVRQIELQIQHLKSLRQELVGKKVNVALKKSGVRGIVWDKINLRWKVRLWRGGHSANVGSFRELEDAITALETAKAIVNSAVR